MSNRKTSNLRRATHLADLYDPATVVLFAGLGGACIGIEAAYAAAGYANRYVDLAVNHWKTAIAVHKANHPMTQHLAEDVWDVDPAEVLPGRPIAYLHASPDCTHFSKARGSKPKKKHIRGLAWVVIRWAKIRRPTVITLENVEEFKDWGPLAKGDQPCPRRKGATFRQWVRALQKIGYQVEWRELRACDYGTPTTRKRLFVVARCDGQPIAWPEKTHGSESDLRRVRQGTANGAGSAGQLAQAERVVPAERRRRHSNGLLPGVHRQDRGEDGQDGGGDTALTPYRTAAECIDWSLPMCSIFATPAEAKAWAAQHGVGVPRRPLKPKTMKRIAAGLVKFVLGAKRPYLVNIQNYGWDSSGTRGVDQPAATVTAYPKGGAMAAVDVQVAPFVARCAHGDQAGTGAVRWGHSSHSVTEPVPTVSGSKDFAAVSVNLAPFTVPNLGERAGQSPRCGSVEQPAPTITGSASGANVVAAFLSKHYTGVVGSDLGTPAGTVTAVDHHSINAVYLSHFYGSSEVGGEGDLAKPIKTVTGSGQHAGLVAAFLATYYGNSTTGLPVDGPAPTIVSKDRVQLVTVVIDGTTYVVTDIAMRMLTPRELARAQGFDDSYVIDRTAAGEPVTKADQVKLVGNSVCPDVMEAIAAANVVTAGVLVGMKSDLQRSA